MHHALSDGPQHHVYMLTLYKEWCRER